MLLDYIYSETLLKDDKYLEGLFNIINIILDTAFTWTDLVKQEERKNEFDIRKELYELTNKENDLTMLDFNIEKKMPNDKLEYIYHQKEVSTTAKTKVGYKAVCEGQSELFCKAYTLNDKVKREIN